MTEIQSESESRIASTSREINAPADRIFELIADPTRQPSWDGMDNLANAPAGQRVHSVGDIFTMNMKNGVVRENHVVEFEEGRRIAWQPAEPGNQPPGHLWRWELEVIDADRTRVTHTYDWTQLHDESRFERARQTTPEALKGRSTDWPNRCPNGCSSLRMHVTRVNLPGGKDGLTCGTYTYARTPFA